MSKISNKLIERKLRELLQLSPSDDLSKFNDDIALTVIFSEYQDEIEFNQATQDNLIKELEQLKVVEIQLRNELRYFKSKEYLHFSRRNKQATYSRQFEQNPHDEKYKKLLQAAEQQRRSLQDNKKSITQLEKKIYESTQANKHISDEKEIIQQQLQSERLKEKEYLAEVEKLRSENAKTVLQYELDMKKYKEEFLEELKETLRKKSEEEDQRNQDIIKQQKDKLKSLEATLKNVLHTISEQFKLKEPASNDEIAQWTEAFLHKIQAYNSEISRTARKELKETKDPLKRLAQHQKKKMQARQFILDNYLSPSN